MHRILDVFLHLDRHLNTLAGDLGGWLYGLLFLIVFCETGLVVTPFLPGDSLLFAVGALATRPGSPINLPGPSSSTNDTVARPSCSRGSSRSSARSRRSLRASARCPTSDSPSTTRYIILAISVISILPIGIEYVRARRESKPATDSVDVIGRAR